MSKRRKFYRSKCVTVDVEIDLADIETDDLIEELKSRDRAEADVPQIDTLIDVRDALMQGRTADALAMLESTIWPKWSNVEDCAKALAEAKQRAA